MNNHKRSQTIVIIIIISMASYYISNAHSHWKEIKWGEKNNYITMWKSRKRKIGKPSNSITTVIFPMKRNSHLWCWFFITHQKMKPWGEKKKIKKVEFVSVSLVSIPKRALREYFSPATSGAPPCTQSSRWGILKGTCPRVHFCSNQMNEVLPLHLCMLWEIRISLIAAA